MKSMNNSTVIPHQATLLLACLQTDETIDSGYLAHISSSEWQSLVDLARVQGVLPIIYYRLKEKKMREIVPAEIWQQITRKYRRTTLRNMKLLRELHRIVKALDEAEIPVVALKGAYLSSIVYPDAGLRSMSDLDLLIPSGDILRAAAIVEAQGYQFPREVDSHDIEFLHLHHLPQMVKEGGLRVEIHGRLTKQDELWDCDPQIWWHEVQTVEINGLKVKVLSPIDLVLHLCIHISYHHRFSIGLKHYYDLVVLLQFMGADLDWDKLIKRAHLYGWGEGVLMVFKVAQSLFNLVLPEEIIKRLDPGENYKEFIDFALVEMWKSPDRKNTFFSREVAEYQFQTGVWAKIDYMRQRIFIPKGLMAQKYPVPVSSLRIYFYYIVRVKDLFCRHFQSLRQMSEGDIERVAEAARKYELWHWLNSDRKKISPGCSEKSSTV
jgi:hypothetical protein